MLVYPDANSIADPGISSSQRVRQEAFTAAANRTPIIRFSPINSGAVRILPMVVSRSASRYANKRMGGDFPRFVAETNITQISPPKRRSPRDSDNSDW